MIRKMIVAVAFVLLTVPYIAAQQPEKGVEAYGIKMGIGFSFMNTEYSELKELFEYKVGFNGGLFLTYRLSQTLSLQPELLLAVKGTKQGVFLSLFDWSENYIELPILLKYNFQTQKKLRPSFYAGPSFSYLISSDFKVLLSEQIDVTEGMKRIDFGLVIGGGLDYRRITFDARYTIGFTDLVDVKGFNKLTEAEPDDFFYITEAPKVNNNFLSFMLGYKF